MLFSRIVYENASFNRSFSVESNLNHMNFLVKTLEECKVISKDELLAIIFTDINNFPKGYLTKTELRQKLIEISSNKAVERKYNQRNYLFNMCERLSGIYINNDKNEMSLNPYLFDKKEKYKGRDAYLQRLYKIALMNEYMEKYNSNKPKCSLEHRAYPVLIASHIKPFASCNEIEAFDKDNGLLLSKNMDSLFDLGYITFNNDGTIITSVELDDDVREYLNLFKLETSLLNNKRQKYIQFHRQNVFRQNKLSN
ncbi:hypothetical protein NPA07_05175 [Mycoplasmopsis caviae]|uniref:HNH nuclease domain-containing protein n=1 Tax=Mycoplasmopsis caviae TaxID=55603 RepID=A0A3P8K9G1_9BACT|nr:HNH endonuclease [Mycoplasmopsis caviae]UUD35166.1 hypothetical protein NPA07_05175 [Mycoplasmopsis caviae]VDR42029.1 Uncharacterised protein [Mycoplasmopsis caviae]